MDVRHAGGRGVSGLSIPRWAKGAGLGCLVVAGIVRVWPGLEPIATQPPSAARYSGSILEPAPSGITPMPTLRFAGLDGATSAPTPEIASPGLVGVITAGPVRAAYLRSAVSGAVEHVAVGEKLDGWRLLGVTATSATLEQGGQRKETHFFANRSSEPY